MDVKFKGTIMDVAFNNKFNMLTVSGYGKQFPIIVAAYNTSKQLTSDINNIEIDAIPDENTGFN